MPKDDKHLKKITYSVCGVIFWSIVSKFVHVGLFLRWSGREMFSSPAQKSINLVRRSVKSVLTYMKAVTYSDSFEWKIEGRHNLLFLTGCHWRKL